MKVELKTIEDLLLFTVNLRKTYNSNAFNNTSSEVCPFQTNLLYTARTITHARPPIRSSDLVPLYLKASHFQNFQQADPICNEFRTSQSLFKQEKPEQYIQKWFDMFAKIDNKFKEVLSFVFNNCAFEDRIVEVIVGRFRDLRELWLGSNIVGDKGAALIAKNLKKLEILSLADNKITDQGATELANHLTQRIQRLFLKSNEQISTLVMFGIVITHPKLKHLGVGSGRARQQAILRVFKTISSSDMKFE